MYSEALIQKLGAGRLKGTPLGIYYKDIAAAAQRR